ncbi:MAG: type IV secretory system conjugative DNA transfer family protein [Lachnospiraceae bacterium]|nr:type IV secretory system conjugative DNA transfer family protein [Lachnospiraceae bacterium]
MVKKYGIWYTVKYYCVIPFAIMAIILAFANNYIFTVSCEYMHLTERHPLYNIYKIAVPVGLTTIWLVIVFTICRDKRYRYLTGRNFGTDSAKYKRTYHELTEYFINAEPHKLDTYIFEKTPWRTSKGIIFGTADKGKLIKIPSDSECNIAIFGPPGSGKTSGIAIINAMSFQGSVLAVDVKGDLYNYVSQHTNRKIVRFCPDAPDALTASVRFDPFAELINMDETDRKLYLESVATVLIADEGGSDGNYFSTRARKMFQGITHLILSENPNASFPDVIHAILRGNVFDWVTQAIGSNCESAKELLSSFYGNSEKNVSSAYDALTTALVHFSNPILDELLSKNGNCISIKTLESGTDLYLQINQEHLDAYAPLFTLLIQSMSTAFTKRPDSSTGVKNRPILMLLDEFPQLTFSYKLINSNLSTLRSKSVICMVIQQNLSQLEYRYQPTGARSILGNCNYQIILGSNDINSSKVFSDTFGKKKVLKISNSETNSQNNTTGRSVQEATEKVFEPEYFGDLSSNNKMIIYFKGKYCEATKLNCYKD